MDPSLARAARALCLVSTKVVALRSGLDEQRIREYEREWAHSTRPRCRR